MKIHIETKKEVEEIEVTILCKEETEQIQQIVASLLRLDQRVLVKQEDESHLVNYSAILYIDSVDKKTFIYTKDEVYETKYKLYELEEQFEFLRINKSCIINLEHVQSLKSEFNRKIRLTMSNSEQLIVSRQYATEFKKRLGVKI